MPRLRRMKAPTIAENIGRSCTIDITQQSQH